MNINPPKNDDSMGRMKELFLEQQYINQAMDSLMDEDYHYKQWLNSQEAHDMWIPERDGRTLEDIERETKEEEDNINLNKG